MPEAVVVVVVGQEGAWPVAFDDAAAADCCWRFWVAGRKGMSVSATKSPRVHRSHCNANEEIDTCVACRNPPTIPPQSNTSVNMEYTAAMTPMSTTPGWERSYSPVDSSMDPTTNGSHSATTSPKRSPLSTHAVMSVPAVAPYSCVARVPSRTRT